MYKLYAMNIFRKNIVVVKNYTEMFHTHSQYINVYSIRQYAAMVV